MAYQEQDQQFEIPPKYIAAFKRFKLPLILGVLVLGAAAGAVAVKLPGVYRSESTVLVETQQIPKDLIQSTVNSAVDEQIQVIKQRVMTRERLMEIANKYPSIKNDSRTALVSGILESMRENITVEPIRVGGRRNSATIAFTVGFDSTDPKVAQAVTSELVTLFMNENVTSRTERATETTEFLEQEAEKMKARLAETEEALSDYKLANKDALPEHRSVYMAKLDRLQGSRSEIQRNMELIRTQKALIGLQSTQSSPAVNQRLIDAEARYQSLLAVYKETHPTLIQLKGEIAQLRKQPVAQGADRSQEIKAKISEADAQLAMLQKDMEDNNTAITALEALIIKIPQVERGLISLNRDYDVVQRQYDEMVSNTMKAQMAENLEEGRKAERFSILEPASLPDKPYKPKREVVVGAGVGASLGIPLALVMLVAFFDKSIRSAKEMERITGYAPLVTIGMIETQSEVSKKNWNRRLWILMAFAALIAGVLAAHYFYTPLDTKIYQLMFKYGLA